VRVEQPFLRKPTLERDNPNTSYTRRHSKREGYPPNLNEKGKEEEKNEENEKKKQVKKVPPKNLEYEAASAFTILEGGTMLQSASTSKSWF